MKLKIYLYTMLFCYVGNLTSTDLANNAGVQGFKGVFTGIESMLTPITQASFWKSMAYGFGLPPAGYVYSYIVYNDSLQTVWVASQKMISFMGATFPSSGGWSIESVAPGQSCQHLNQNYYFELYIKNSSDSYSSHMPYLQHDDVLYLQDCITLPQDKNSPNQNIFRVFQGKNLVNGVYQYAAQAEALGYINPANSKDPNALVKTTTLSNCVIKNSTNKNVLIGFAPSSVPLTSMKTTICPVVTEVAANSFATLGTFQGVPSLAPGTIAAFDVETQNCLAVLQTPAVMFEYMPYTAEIYDDQQSINMVWQGVTAGNYDPPAGQVQDITPITACFWYQSAQQAKSGTDLPGTVWIMSVSNTSEIIGSVEPGQAVEFTINRPMANMKKQIYFLYVNEPDKVKSQIFLENFMQGKIGTQVVDQYQRQAAELMSKASVIVPANNAKTVTQSPVSASVITQAASGSLTMNRGQIVDPQAGVVGYLLGSDIFLSQGVGSLQDAKGNSTPIPMYYVLYPSLQNTNNLPTGAVINLYGQQAVTSAPTGMPTPTTFNVASSSKKNTAARKKAKVTTQKS